MFSFERARLWTSCLWTRPQDLCSGWRTSGLSRRPSSGRARARPQDAVTVFSSYPTYGPRLRVRLDDDRQR